MYDLIIIGSGPAGYVAAERAGEYGGKVLLIEQDKLGGVCLNTGCIPTKSMLYSAKLFAHIRHAEEFGVKVDNPCFNYQKVKTRTEGIQEKLRGGIGALMKMGKTEVVTGKAVLKDRNTVTVNQQQSYTAKNILIATGSRPFVPPIPGLADNKCVLTNESILALEKMPEHLAVIGGGVIGTEFACLYSMAGKKVTVIEMLGQICGNTDKELAKTVQKKLEKNGVKFHLKAKVTEVNGGKITFTNSKEEVQNMEADLILVSTGRAVNTKNLGLEAAGIDFDRQGIKVNEKAQTNVPCIWAAGDVTGRWQLAHFASRQATVAVNNIFGQADICRENAVPAVVYTDPEIASVGITEDQAKEKGIKYKTAKYPLTNNGRFLAETTSERGVCKVVIGEEYGELLGVHIVGPGASEMIATAVTMLETELRASDIKEIIFPHPTIGEVMHDAMFGLK